MRLSALAEAVGGPVFPPQAGNIDIKSIHYRSDSVAPGGLFVALKGSSADGHSFVRDAAERGASAVVVEDEVEKPEGTAVIRVENSRKALGLIASRFYDNPSEKLFMIGVTGTNGKTTTAYLLENILVSAGLKTGVIGTINYRYCGRVFDSLLTTPEAPELQKILADMAASGVTHVIMEVSSHGLELDRVAGCRFDTAVFTNLSQDHLDFHGSMRAYMDAKKKLFAEHLRPAQGGEACTAVVNVSCPEGREIACLAGGCRLITVGWEQSESVCPAGPVFDQYGIKSGIRTPEGEISISSMLVGRFNLENIMCAAAVGSAMGIRPEILKTGIQSFSSVPGRLERVCDQAGRNVFVDYAHTPEALENVLETLRQSFDARIICVFGCGGDRDRGKRPKMGEIAGRLSDLVIVTSDNPRTEPPMSIIEEIMKGVRRTRIPELEASRLGESSRGCLVEPDRKEAIIKGIKAAKPGDAVLIAGKGHEACQIIGRKTLAFDDREAARQGLSLN